MKVGAIIQARHSSNRLPGKVLKSLPYGSGISALAQVVRRVQACDSVDQVIVATSTHDEDDAILPVAKSEGADVFRGSLHDVLDRFYQAATYFELDHIVRITSDCPCLDPEIMNLVIHDHFSSGADLTSSGLERTFPVGQDLGIFSYRNLKEAADHAKEKYEREHVTPYFYKTHADKFRVNVVHAPQKWHMPDLRLTLDMPSDYTFLCTLYDDLYEINNLFSLDDILSLLSEKPWLQQINQGIKQKKVFQNLREEMEEGINYCKEQDLHRLRDFLTEEIQKLD